MIKFTTTALPGVTIIEPQIFPDERGYFFETFQAERYHSQGLPVKFVQDNFSHSKKDVVRGLHYQLERPQGKLVNVLSGRILDIIVDIRLDSPTFGQHVAIELDDKSHKQIYIPPGFAHGFCALSDNANVLYKCTDFYHKPSERGIIWNDPELNLPWPVKTPILSPKDLVFSKLSEMAKDQLPRYKA